MNYLRKLLGLCVHEWEIIETFTIHKVYSGKITGEIYVQRCKKCGKLHNHKVSNC